MADFDPVWYLLYNRMKNGRYIPTTISNVPVASITDAAAKSLSELIIDINPVQDLHGYANPWPAGGGKNKFDVSKIESHTDKYGGIISQSNGTISVTTSTGSSNVRCGKTLRQLAPLLTVGETYIITGNSTATSAKQIYLYAVSALWKFGDPLTITQEVLNSEVGFYANGTNTSATITQVMIRLSSVSDATFASYSNICPISGWDAVNVWDDSKYGGVIEWNQLVQNGHFESISGWTALASMLSASSNELTIAKTNNISYGGIAYQQINNLNKSHIYFLSVDAKSVDGETSAYLHFLTSDFTSGGNAYITTKSTSFTKLELIARPQNDNDIFALKIGISTSARGSTGVFKNAQLFDLTQLFGAEKADEIYAMEQATPSAGVAYFRSLFPHDYYDYNTGTETVVSAVNGDPYWNIPITIPTPPGTVYGGTLDVTTGVLTVTWRYANMKTDLVWSAFSSGAVQFFTALPSGTSAKATGTAMLCNEYATDTNGWSSSQANNTVSGSTSNGRIYARDDSCADADAFTTAAADKYIAYPLATPVTYQLDPTTIQLLKGSNNIWATTGDINTLVYLKDPKLS